MACSVLWCLAVAGSAVQRWHELDLSRVYAARPECRSENPRPPEWCNRPSRASGEFSPKPYLLLGVLVPAGALVLGYAVRWTIGVLRK